jgi:hypothetical protein
MDFYNDPFTIFIDDLPAIYNSAMDINGPLSISELPSDELRGIDLFPNPAHEYLNIRNGNDSGQVNFRILDCNGKLIREGLIHPESTASIAVNQYSKGIYLLRIENSNGEFKSEKFVVK